MFAAIAAALIAHIAPMQGPSRADSDLTSRLTAPHESSGK